MAVEELVVDETLESMLGRNGLGEVADALWAEDCQTRGCGRPLGSAPPSLCVDVLGDDRIVASLHHQGCRDPGWKVWPPSIIPFYAGMTHVWTLGLVSAQVTGRRVLIPVLVINPSLEQVRLRQEAGGRWCVAFPPEFVQAGLCTAADGGGIIVGRPVAGAGVQFRGAAMASLVLGSYPDPRFELEMDQDQLAAIRRLNGVLVVVSHVVHPGLLRDWARVMAALESGRAIVGWVGVRAESAEARDVALAEITSAVSKHLNPRSGTSGEPTYVLYFDPGRVTIGELLGEAEDDLSEEQVPSWARTVLGDTASRLFDWIGTQGAEHVTADPLSFEEFFLRKRDHRWQLVRVLAHRVTYLSHLPGPGSEEEARAWAAEVLRLKAGVSVPSWRAGPGSRSGGVTTLYTSGAASG